MDNEEIRIKDIISGKYERREITKLNTRIMNKRDSQQITSQTLNREDFDSENELDSPRRNTSESNFRLLEFNDKNKRHNKKQFFIKPNQKQATELVKETEMDKKEKNIGEKELNTLIEEMFELMELEKKYVETKTQIDKKMTKITEELENFKLARIGINVEIESTRSKISKLKLRIENGEVEEIDNHKQATHRVKSQEDHQHGKGLNKQETGYKKIEKIDEQQDTHEVKSHLDHPKGKELDKTGKKTLNTSNPSCKITDQINKNKVEYQHGSENQHKGNFGGRRQTTTEGNSTAENNRENQTGSQSQGARCFRCSKPGHMTWECQENLSKDKEDARRKKVIENYNKQLKRVQDNKDLDQHESEYQQGRIKSKIFHIQKEWKGKDDARKQQEVDQNGNIGKDAVKKHDSRNKNEKESTQVKSQEKEKLLEQQLLKSAKELEQATKELNDKHPLKVRTKDRDEEHQFGIRTTKTTSTSSMGNDVNKNKPFKVETINNSIKDEEESEDKDSWDPPSLEDKTDQDYDDQLEWRFGAGNSISNKEKPRQTSLENEEEIRISTNTVNNVKSRTGNNIEKLLDNQFLENRNQSTESNKKLDSKETTTQQNLEPELNPLKRENGKLAEGDRKQASKKLTECFRCKSFGHSICECKKEINHLDEDERRRKVVENLEQLTVDAINNKDMDFDKRMEIVLNAKQEIKDLKEKWKNLDSEMYDKTLNEPHKSNLKEGDEDRSVSIQQSSRIGNKLHDATRNVNASHSLGNQNRDVDQNSQGTNQSKHQVTSNVKKDKWETPLLSEAEELAIRQADRKFQGRMLNNEETWEINTNSSQSTKLGDDDWGFCKSNQQPQHDDDEDNSQHEKVFLGQERPNITSSSNESTTTSNLKNPRSNHKTVDENSNNTDLVDRRNNENKVSNKEGDNCESNIRSSSGKNNFGNFMNINDQNLNKDFGKFLIKDENKEKDNNTSQIESTENNSEEEIEDESEEKTEDKSDEEIEIKINSSSKSVSNLNQQTEKPLNRQQKRNMERELKKKNSGLNLETTAF